MKKALLILIAIITASCTGMVNPEAKKLKVKSEWLSPSPEIRPVSDKNKIVYVSVRNTSGSNLNIKNDVISKVTEQGYRITGDLEEASFVLMADLRYHGETKDKNHYNAILGGVGGAAVGGVIGNNVSKENKGRNTAIGAGGGALLGALIGNMVDNKEQIMSYDIIVDLSIGELIEGGVKNSVNGNSTRGLGQAAKTSSGRSVESGNSSSASNNNSSFTRTEKFYYHKARLLCSATKMNLTEEESMSPLSNRLSNSIGQLLP